MFHRRTPLAGMALALGGAVLAAAPPAPSPGEVLRKVEADLNQKREILAADPDNAYLRKDLEREEHRHAIILGALGRIQAQEAALGTLESERRNHLGRLKQAPDNPALLAALAATTRRIQGLKNGMAREQELIRHALPPGLPSGTREEHALTRLPGHVKGVILSRLDPGSHGRLASTSRASNQDFDRDPGREVLDLSPRQDSLTDGMLQNFILRYPGVKAVSLRLSGETPLTDRGIRLLEQLPALESLHVNLEGSRISRQLTHALCSLNLPRIRTIDLVDPHAGGGALHPGPLFRGGIETLSLTFTHRGDTLARMFALDHLADFIARHGGFRELKSLTIACLSNLYIGNLTPGGAARLAASENLKNLEHLRLCRLGESGNLMTILGSPHLGKVSSLELPDNSLFDENLVELLALPLTWHLRSLNVSDNEFGPGGVEALAHSQALESLAALDLSRNYIGNSGLDSLVNSPLFGRIEHLNLRGCTISGLGLEDMARSPGSGRLLSLDLGGNYLTADSIADLLARGKFPRLARLDLTGCPVTPEMVRGLGASPQGGRLRELTLSLDGKEAPDGRRRLLDALKAHPGIRVRLVDDAPKGHEPGAHLEELLADLESPAYRDLAISVLIPGDSPLLQARLRDHRWEAANPNAPRIPDGLLEFIRP